LKSGQENAFDFAAEHAARTRANDRANAGKARDYIGRHPQQQASMEIAALSVSGEPPLTSRPAVVLDTNVVLDWLLFDEPAVAGLATAVAQGHVRWLASAAMRDELAHVLQRGLGPRRQADPTHLLRVWDALARPAAAAATHPLRCTDPDDQKFLDLALASGARWLVSRDRALLRLRRRAAGLGLAIVTPEGWRLCPSDTP
jgi:putative PIN family toxin of toxin-antitoxin system